MATEANGQKRADTPLMQAGAQLALARTRDRGKLIALLGKWRKTPDDANAKNAFLAKLDESIQSRNARAAQLPSASVQADLPIAAHAEDIVRLIRTHQVVVLAGETGSGKTTQLPKLCLMAGRGAAGMIGCTQPRRIAARSVARRVAEELGVPMGGAVGYQVRFTESVGDATAIKFMTDGILLAEIHGDRWLSKYDTLIIDEAHERSLNIDFLLGYLKQLLPKRPDLKVIVTSATIDTSRFSAHFQDAPVVEVEGRTFPVEVRYRPIEGGSDSDGERTVLDGIVAACDEITREDPMGDTLIFLPGEREIRDAHLALERRKYRSTEIVPLYARLSGKDQDAVFHPGPKRRIVLATNVAETSLTVPRIRYVVDPGFARVKRYSPRLKLDRLHIESISQASAEQRKGRCGRVASGICIRLYSEADFQSRDAFTDPEIRRSALAGIILRMLSIGLGEIDAFPFLEPPDPRAIADGWQQLLELGAVSNARTLTAIGKQMAKLPVDVKLSRMLVAAQKHGCLAEMLTITSFIGIQDPRERPADQRQAADTAHAQFADPKSEFVGILKLWDAFRQAHEDLSQSQLRKWAERNFLGFLRLREWRELHRQLKLICEDMNWSSNSAAAEYAPLHRALIAGLPTHIGHLGDQGLYDGVRGRKFRLFPGSALAKKPPAWVLSATLLDTEKLWAMTNAAIEPDWVIAELPHLLHRRHHDPRWSRSQGRVLGSEQISLFGLVLAPKKPVNYGALYPDESRGIFVRDGLVTGEINSRSAFVARNLAVIEAAREEEAKQRRVGIVVDEDWQARWYLDRLPADVHDTQALDAWVKRLDAKAKDSLHWSRDDVLVADETDATLFPPYMAHQDVRLAVRYRFDPGAVDDGMTLVVPLHLLNALDAAALSWMAPGFVQDKASALIKGLPKALRRNFVPAPDFAKAFKEAHPAPEADAITGALARFLKKLTGVEVAATDFDEAGLEAHLKINLQLQESDSQTVLAQSRDLDALRSQFAQRAHDAFTQRAARDWIADDLRTFPSTPMPRSVRGDGGIPAFPALVDAGDSVALRVFPTQSEADAAHSEGVKRLMAFALEDKAKKARKQLPIPAKTGLLYAAIESTAPRRSGLKDSDRLREDLVAGAIAALMPEALSDIRDRKVFEAQCSDIGKALFAESMRRLQQAEAILDQVTEIRGKLESRLMGWAAGNLADMQAHLAALAFPGFLRDMDTDVLAQYPRYLRALSLRAERAQRDPSKDQSRMLELKPFVDALDTLKPAQRLTPSWVAFRKALEELRVATFAQELGFESGTSVKKLHTRLERLHMTR